MSPFTGPVIVVVDDDDAVRQSLKFSLEIEGFRVKAYRSGEELLAEKNLPLRGCFVVDYRMPSIDGLTLIGRLRLLVPALPAILITAKATSEVRRRALQTGCSEVLEKPLEDSSLVDSIRTALASTAGDDIPRPA